MVAPFLAAVALGRQPRASLFAVYRGWMDALIALEAARQTGRFEVPIDAERRGVRLGVLREFRRLEAEIGRLRSAAAREKQIARQVELNLSLKGAEAALAAARARL